MRSKAMKGSNIVITKPGAFGSKWDQVESKHPELSRDTFADGNRELRVVVVEVEANKHFKFRRREAQVHNRRKGGSLCNRAKSDA